MSVCRYYLRGNCHFGERCRFLHVDNTPAYSDRRDYGYREEYHQHSYNKGHYGSQGYASNNRYSEQQSYASNNRYSEQQSYASNNRYSEQQGYSARNRYDSNPQYYAEGYQQQYQNNRNSYSHYDKKSQGYSDPGNRYSVLNQPQSNFQGNRNEWESDDFESDFEDRSSRGSSKTYNTSTPKSKVPFSFKDPNPSAKRDQSSDLHMNHPNMLYADIMRKDVAEWEQGNMWLFTCYSPITDKPSYPGFIDFSSEELRLEAYKAKENNSYNAYIESTEKAILEVKRKRDELKEPSVKLMSNIEKYRNGETFGAEYNMDIGNFFSGLSSKGGLENMIADDSQAPKQSLASSFSFKTTLETDSAVKMSASSFSFKLPSDSLPKQNIPLGISNIYTPLEELALQDKEQFLASTFSLGKIPTVPPPKAMCF